VNRVTDLERTAQSNPISLTAQPGNLETGIVLLLADGTIAACNEVAQTLLGMTIEQLQDTSPTALPWQTIHPDGTAFPGHTHPAMVTLETGQPCCNVAMGLYQPEGHLVWLNVDAHPLFRRGETAPYAVTVSITRLAADSTPTRIGATPIEQKINLDPPGLSSYEHRWQILFQSLPIGVVLVDPIDATILEFNDAAAANLGYTREEFARLSIADIDVLLDPVTVLEYCQTIANHPTQTTFQTQHRTKSGERRDVMVIGHPVDVGDPSELGGSNRILAYGIWIDITDRNVAAIALHEANSQLEMALTAGSICTWRWNIPENVLMGDRNLAHLFGMDPEAVASGLPMEPFLEAIHPEDRSMVEAAINRAIETGEHYQAEYRVYDAAGAVRWVLARGWVEYDTDGSPLTFPGAIADISDRKQMEAALRESEERSRNILESISDGFFAVDKAWRFTYINQAAEHLLNRSSDDLVGKTMWEEYPGLLESEFGRIYRETMDDRRVGAMTAFYPDHDRWYEARSYPARQGITVYFRNVTAQVQGEAALRQSEEQLRLATESANLGLWYWNVQEDTLEWTPQCKALFGLPADIEMTYDLFLNALHPDDRHRTHETVLQCLQSRIPYDIEYRTQWPDGTLRWIAAKGNCTYDAAGQPIRMMGITIDITDRKQIEAELWQKNAILKVINDSTPTPIYVKDREGRIIFANPATLEVLGKPESQVIGYRDDEIYPGFGEVVVENDRRIMETGQLEVVEESPDGVRTFLGVKVPYRDETGAVIGLIGVASDISDRVQLERDREQVLNQAQAAREVSERANRIKDEFLSVLSHELRTPLNPILGWIRLMKAGKLDAVRTREAISIIERNAQLQAQLINDLLDISRILQGKLALNQEPVHLETVITAAQETVRLAAEAKAITITTAFEDSNGQVLGDAGRLQQVVWNLLTNAIKFTPDGGEITVRLARTENQAQIQVRDTGKGIASDFLPHVFERFRQADSSTTRKFGGLGLGLAIVRQLVELHGGTVDVESLGEGYGATFMVCLPLLTASSEPPIQDMDVPADCSPGCSLSGYQILVVDDDLDSREFVTFALNQHGAIVTQAASASEALAVLSHTQFDVLVSDIGMPEMNGYTLMQQIRAKPAEHGGQIPALALTAYADEGSSEQALQAGFGQHLAKPIDVDQLVTSVVRLVNSTAFV
jgi:PAS domain S-box-containing protein